MNKSRKVLYTIIFITLLAVFSIIGGEFVCRMVDVLGRAVKKPVSGRYKRDLHNNVTDKLVNSKAPLDYLDVVRLPIGPDIWLGGDLKENFDNFVIGGYGRPVKFKTNSTGFRYDKDVAFNPAPGVIRILSLGDSFTAGYRIGQEETFSRLLENYFNAKEKGNKYEVLISLIIAPSRGLLYLSTYGIKFRPAVVILGITLGNDILEGSGIDSNRDNKAIPDACLSKKTVSQNSLINKSMLYRKLNSLYEGEAIVSWYGDMHPPRLFDVMNGLGFYIKDAPEEITDAYNKLFATLSGYKRLAAENNFKFIVVIFPQRFQVQKEDWKKTIEYYGLRPESFDLMKPNKLIRDFCKKEDIVCIDPTTYMTVFYNKERKSLYFLLGDMHWNALGNKVLCDAIKDDVYRIIMNN